MSNTIFLSVVLIACWQTTKIHKQSRAGKILIEVKVKDDSRRFKVIEVSFARGLCEKRN